MIVQPADYCLVVGWPQLIAASVWRLQIALLE
jgi:hypothetical protein